MALDQANELWLQEVFTYHAPNETQLACYESIRRDAKTLAYTILEQTPHCADQAAALRLLREAVMTANAAVALKGLV